MPAFSDAIPLSFIYFATVSSIPPRPTSVSFPHKVITIDFPVY
jgi:hypothetical protein